MKNIILDTDIGGDCDDAGALVLLKTLCEEKKISLNAITSCTTMEGAEHTIASVLAYYGMKVPIGIMHGEPFMCEGDFNRYARQIKQEFGAAPETEDAVRLLRRTLADTQGKTTIIAIGPQRNLARFLASGPDDCSPLTGLQLAAEKVEELVVMGGAFLPEEEATYFEDKNISIEWNIEQDIPAAQKVADEWPTPVVYNPFEVGFDIETGRNLPAGSPARRCYDIRSGLTRASWDPCAAYYGAVGCGELFSLSEKGRVSFDGRGYSVFTPAENGLHRILTLRADKRAVEEELDRLMR